MMPSKHEMIWFEDCMTIRFVFVPFAFELMGNPKSKCMGCMGHSSSGLPVLYQVVCIIH
jgi:hypothetical protein